MCIESAVVALERNVTKSTRGRAQGHQTHIPVPPGTRRAPASCRLCPPPTPSVTRLLVCHCHSAPRSSTSFLGLPSRTASVPSYHLVCALQGCEHQAPVPPQAALQTEPASRDRLLLRGSGGTQRVPVPKEALLAPPREVRAREEWWRGHSRPFPARCQQFHSVARESPQTLPEVPGEQNCCSPRHTQNQQAGQTRLSDTSTGTANTPVPSLPPPLCSPLPTIIP